MTQGKIEEPSLTPGLSPRYRHSLSLPQRGGQDIDSRIIVRYILLVSDHEFAHVFGDRVFAVHHAHLILAIARMGYEISAHHSAIGGIASE